MAHLSNSFKSFKLLLCVLCLSNLYSWVGASWKHNTESMIVNSEKEEAEGVFKIAIKAEVSHIGIVGGVGQAGLEWTGYKKTGMIVGVTWNVVKWGSMIVVTNSEKQVAEGVFKRAIKAGVSHIGIVADISQAGLKWAGYKKTGMIVGATWNVVKWGKVGLAAGGPVGALVGGVVGLTHCGVGELFEEFSK